MTIEAGIVIIINNIKRSESGWIGNGFFILFFYIYYFASFAFRAIVGIYDPFRNCIHSGSRDQTSLYFPPGLTTIGAY